MSEEKLNKVDTSNKQYPKCGSYRTQNINTMRWMGVLLSISIGTIIFPLAIIFYPLAIILILMAIFGKKNQYNCKECNSNFTYE